MTANENLIEALKEAAEQATLDLEAEELETAHVLYAQKYSDGSWRAAWADGSSSSLDGSMTRMGPVSCCRDNFDGLADLIARSWDEEWTEEA